MIVALVVVTVSPTPIVVFVMMMFVPDVPTVRPSMTIVVPLDWYRRAIAAVPCSRGRGIPDGIQRQDAADRSRRKRTRIADRLIQQRPIGCGVHLLFADVPAYAVI